jgi:hypothetical protein
MQTCTLPARNPTSYSFAFPLEELRARVIAGLALGEQSKNPVFRRQKGSGGRATLHVKEAESASWIEVLKFPGNERDLYLSASHDPLWESPIYRGPDDGLPFLADFHLHLTAIRPTLTLVTVTAVRPEVLNGKTWGVGSCGPGTFNRYVGVEPTSVEEYVILRYIGSILGAGSMPDVILPTP